MAVATGVLPIEGATLGFGTAQAGPFTNILEITAIKPPGVELEKVDTSNLASVTKTARPGLIPDQGDVEFDVNYNLNEPTHMSLLDLAVPGAQNPPKWWQIAFPNDGNTGVGATHLSAAFQAILLKIDPDSADENNNITATITLNVISVPVWTQGSSS